MLLKNAPQSLRVKVNEMITRYFIYIFVILSFVACNNPAKKINSTIRPGKNEIADLNRYFVEKDRERIQSYIERKNLKMRESPTGLWYLIKNEGTGDFIKDNDKVTINFECYLLDGTNCYSSAKLGPKKITMGKSEMEAGLNEGLRLLKPGASATLILPPYLAYGLLGDGNKIPARSIIVYDITLMGVR
jgi:FKBP-type peptidyl-prolyl cis-trans isomerase FkpA